MARTLSDAYNAVITGNLTRHPTCRVFVYYGEAETELEITAFVQAVEVTTAFEHEAGSATLTVLNGDGRFDPLGSGPYASALAEHTKVVIQMGDGEEVFTVFTGRFASGSIVYDPTPPSTITVGACDLGKRLWDERVTSAVFRGAEVNDILSAVLVDECGVPAGDLDLAAQSYVVDQVQFVEELGADIAWMLMLPWDYRAGYDYDGKFRSRANAAPGSSSWDYDGHQVVQQTYEWDDPAVNSVTVLGRYLSTTEDLGAAAKIGNITGDILRHERTVNGVHWSTLGGEFIGCFLSKGAGDLHDDDWWTAVFNAADDPDPWPLNPIYSDRVKEPGGTYAPGVAWKCPGSGDSHYLDAEVWGQSTTANTPRAKATYTDASLSALYGLVPLEISDPILQTDGDCLSVATVLVNRYKENRYRPQITVAQNLTHEPGDRITFVSKETNSVVAAQVYRVTHSLAVGTDQAWTVLDLIRL